MPAVRPGTCCWCYMGTGVVWLIKEKIVKFPTQHKNFKYAKNGKKPEAYRAHRDSSQVWVTGGDKGAIVFSHVFTTVSAVKAWMNKPSLAA